MDCRGYGREVPRLAHLLLHDIQFRLGLIERQYGDGVFGKK